MALPSSGTLSISDILTEGKVSASQTATMQGLVSGDYFTINTSSPSYPPRTVPHLMSDWYGYGNAPQSVDLMVYIKHEISNIVANFWGGVVTYTLRSTIQIVLDSNDPQGAYSYSLWNMPSPMSVSYNYNLRVLGWGGASSTETKTVIVESDDIFNLSSTVTGSSRIFRPSGARLDSANTVLQYAPENYNITFVNNY